jgi:hypothetical protein
MWADITASCNKKSTASLLGHQSVSQSFLIALSGKTVELEMIYLQVKSFTWSQLLRTISILGKSFSAMANMTER